MLSENERHELPEGLRRYLDEGTVALLMAQLFTMDPDRFAPKDELAELRGELRDEIADLRLDTARQTRQLTLPVLVALLAQFAATTAVITTVA